MALPVSEAPPSESASLVVTLFGPMQVSLAGRPLPPLRSRKSLWLLALLALRRGQTVEREWLAETLWPDADPEQSLSSLRTILSEMRKALGSEGERLRSPSRHTLLFEVGGADVDVLTFDAAIQSGKRSALEQAVRLYRGPLLEGCAEEWVGQERLVREQDCRRALGTLADAALTAGAYEAAAEYSRRAVALDSWSDAARRSLMEALTRGGDTNAAIQVYREFLEVLRSDPKAVPAEETSALYGRLRKEARDRAAAPATAAVREPTDSSVTGYLPHPLTDLVGREEERLEVAARLRRSRLVTLTGPGGIGKTRLALEVAAETVSEFPDGVWLVALEALAEGSQVERQVASVLRAREVSGQPLRESLTGHLRSKRLLLVLDNCEHLRDASAEIAGHLLRECSGVRMLATSREALGITGETVWAVPALAVPDTDHLPTGQVTRVRVASSYEGVQLFVERAQSVQKTFALTSDNVLPVAQICARLGGLPLAIELAAARVRSLTAAQIASRLDDHLSLLTGGSRASSSRQQTLRATLDWSYALLNDAEQLLLGRLSVFADGWDLEAAEAVCSGEGIEAGQVLDLLAFLVDKSLVAFEDRRTPARGFAERAGTAWGRYRLLETVRQYASERLEGSGESARVRANHRDYFLALVKEAEPLLTGADQVTQMARLEVEHGNLRAALAWCEAEQDGSEAGLHLAGGLWQFWEAQGRYEEGRAYLSRALGRPGARHRTISRAKALNAAGVLASYQGDHKVTRALHEESLEISRELGNSQGVAWSLYDLGNVAVAQGDIGTGRALHEESLAIFRELGYKRGIAVSLHQLGNQVSKQGDRMAARALYGESLAIFRELGNKQGTAWSLNDLGSLIREQGDPETARTLYEESLEIYRELEHKRGIGWSLHQLGRLAREQGDPKTARTLYKESLEINRELADRQGVAWSLNDLGEIVREQGDFGAARTLYEESLAISREMEHKGGIGWSLHHLGSLAHEQGDFGAARTLHEESLAIFRGLGDKQATAWSLNDLGKLVRGQGDREAARALYEESLAIFRELGNRQGTGWTLHQLGEVVYEKNDPETAQTLYKESIGILRDFGDKKGVAACLGGLAGTLVPQAAAKAVRLWGAAQSLRERVSALRLPHEQKLYDRQVARVRAVLDEDALTSAWIEGRALTWEQAVAYALEEVGEENRMMTPNDDSRP